MGLADQQSNDYQAPTITFIKLNLKFMGVPDTVLTYCTSTPRN